eukprot:4592209-Pyramimonas_sp.AAC.1
MYCTEREGDPGGGGLQGTRPRAGRLGGPASRGLAPIEQQSVPGFHEGGTPPNRLMAQRPYQIWI